MLTHNKDNRSMIPLIYEGPGVIKFTKMESLVVAAMGCWEGRMGSCAMHTDGEDEKVLEMMMMVMVSKRCECT